MTSQAASSPRIIYTRHAQDKFAILKRHGFELTPEQIEQTVLDAEWVEQQPGGRLLAQRAINEHHVLRVIYRREEQNYVIITFYPGRRARYETQL